MSKRILVVDDSQLVTKVVTGVLIDAGYEVEAVNSPFGVPEALNRFRPDMVMMDLNIPGLNGTKIIELITAKDYDFDFCIVVYSSEDDDALKQAADMKGVSGYIRKGVKQEELVSSVARYLEQARFGKKLDKALLSKEDPDPEEELRNITI